MSLKDYYEAMERVKPTVIDLCNNHEQFLDCYIAHHNRWQKDFHKSQQPPRTKEHYHKHPIITKFFEDIQPNDILQFWTWNGGFLAYSEGYQIKRGDTIIANVVTCVS
jgi:hypothetical protein